MNKQIYKICVNGKTFELDVPAITGGQLLQLVGLHHSTNYEILKHLKPDEAEPVETDTTIELSESAETIFTIRPYPEAVLEIDDECYPFTEVFMTPVEIMELAGLKDGEFYLKQIVEHQEITYKNDKTHIIALHDRAKFVSCKTASTTVS